jgi:hypothetical protein
MRTPDPNIADRQRRWDEQITAPLPELLTKLLESPLYGAAPDRPKPPEAYGVYLFSERGKPCYVGRVGLTERARRAGKGKGFSNFRTRLNGHTARRAQPNEATYAYTLTCEVFRDRGIPLAQTRAANRDNPAFKEEFLRQIQRVTEMDFQVVEIDDDRLAAVFEVYAATVLGLDQSFAVS